MVKLALPNTKASAQEMSLLLLKQPTESRGWCGVKVQTLKPNLVSLNNEPLAQEMALFLQKLPTGGWGEREVETVLSRAYMWRTSFDQAQSHLSQS